MQKETSHRTAHIQRKTQETEIDLILNLDGSGETLIHTGFGMADHMLTLLSFWADFDVKLTCQGDLHIDAHHTIEDIGICLGQALYKALGNKKYIARTAFAKVPMDEALAEVCLDISGRGYHVMRGQELLPSIIAKEENDVWREFFKAFASSAGMNLHVLFLYGQNGHHLLESAFKGLGLALCQAVTLNRKTLLSTKGSFD